VQARHHDELPATAIRAGGRAPRLQPDRGGRGLHTSQPGISRQIRELEDELGVEIFVRSGKRLTGLTPAGERVLPWVERLLLDAENLHRAGEDFRHGEVGTLSIAATHSQARYALPSAVHDFCSAHPHVQLQMHQGSAVQIARMLQEGWPTSALPPTRWRTSPSWWPCPATAGPMWSSCRRAMPCWTGR
jgi:DNA-binding transcriptional LysR family regulator